MPVEVPTRRHPLRRPSEEEKEHWDATGLGERAGRHPTQVAAEAVNKWLFNADTVDKVLETLMTRGQGRRWRPARQDDHLRQEQRSRRVHRRAVRRELPRSRGTLRPGHHLRRDLRAVADRRLLDQDKAPHIAVSVDMLDTGSTFPRS